MKCVGYARFFSDFFFIVEFKQKLKVITTLTRQYCLTCAILSNEILFFMCNFYYQIFECHQLLYNGEIDSITTNCIYTWIPLCVSRLELHTIIVYVTDS